MFRVELFRVELFLGLDAGVYTGDELEALASAWSRVKLAVATGRVGAVDAAVYAVAIIDRVSVAGSFAAVVGTFGSRSTVASVAADVAEGAVAVDFALGRRRRLVAWNAGFVDAIAVSITTTGEAIGAGEFVIAEAGLFAERAAKRIAGANAAWGANISVSRAVVTGLNPVSAVVPSVVVRSTIVLDVKMAARGKCHRESRGGEESDFLRKHVCISPEVPCVRWAFGEVTLHSVCQDGNSVGLERVRQVWGPLPS